MIKFFFSTLVAVVAIIAVTYVYSNLGDKQGKICDQRYALCSAAQCIPDPTNPNESICFCDVFEGKNYGYSLCDKRLPTTDQEGVQHLISTFSLENLDTRKSMNCAAGSLWSDCLDQPCVVDPLDPKKAICMCKVIRTGEFMTYGGDCDTSTCSTGFWSGAPPDMNAQGVQLMMQALGMKTSPQKFCPK
ncbi:MAG: hypothetical protein H7A37_07715 [Chlamydiales bacterium]|nr:hypothetical protein [Chlamydiales bacterium]